MTILRTTDGLEIKRTAQGSDYELEIIDGKEQRTFYVKDRKSLTDLLEDKLSELDSGIDAEKW